MKNVYLLVTAFTLIVMPFRFQAQSLQATNMTVPQFRQALMDLATYADAQKGTNLASRIQAIPDDVLEKLLPGVPNARDFQNAASKIRNSLGTSSSSSPTVNLASGVHLTPSDVPQNANQYPNCPANTIIDDSQNAVCTPEYPVASDTVWQTLINPVINSPLFPAFPSFNGDYAALVNQVCDRDIEAAMSIAVSALNGTVNAASDGCNALPSPGANVCFGIVTPIAVTGAIFQGLFADCSEQDADVNFAKVDASFHNTVTIYNALSNLGTVVGSLVGDGSTTESNTQTLLTDLTTFNNNLTTVGNNLTTQVSGVDTDVLNVKTTVTNTGTNLSNQIKGVDSDVSTVGTGLATQLTGVTTDLTTRATTIDKEITTQQALELRLQIEASLASSNPTPVILFEVPQSAGGYIELVRSIVADVYQKMISTGQNVYPGFSLIAADAFIASGNYLQAYQELKRNYLLAVQL